MVMCGIDKNAQHSNRFVTTSVGAWIKRLVRLMARHLFFLKMNTHVMSGGVVVLASGVIAKTEKFGR
jgi:hypothetical protein